MDTFKIFRIWYTRAITISTAQNNLKLYLLHVKSRLSNLCHFYDVMNIETISTQGFRYLLQQIKQKLKKKLWRIILLFILLITYRIVYFSIENRNHILM